MNRPAFVDCLVEAYELLNAEERASALARMHAVPLTLIRQAKQEHADAGRMAFHEGAVAALEELERVAGGGE